MAPRAKLEAALDFVREGDTLTVTKPDRLARSATDLLSIISRLEAKGVALRVLSMGGSEVDTQTPTGRLILTMLGAVAEFERALMLERQREGIAKAKAEGKYKGRVPTAQRQTAQVLKLRAEGVKPAEIAARLGIGRASVYRALQTAAWPKRLYQPHSNQPLGVFGNARAMSLFADPPPPDGARPEPELTAAEGPFGGPSYTYRGAVIDCHKGGHVCALHMPDHPLHGRGFGVVGTITPLVDLWLDEGRLPSYMRLVSTGRRRK